MKRKREKVENEKKISTVYGIILHPTTSIGNTITITRINFDGKSKSHRKSANFRRN